MMIQRVVAWWRESRAWTAEHRSTWPAYTTLIDGKSRLLTDTEKAIQHAASLAGFAVSDRVQEWMASADGGREVYVRFKLVPSPVEVWLQSNGAQIDSPMKCAVFEEWSFRTPQDFIVHVSEAAVKMASETRA